MTTGESPDPKAACGYPAGWVGRPIFLSLPAPAAFVASSIVGPSGPVAHCPLHANPFEAGAPLLEAGDTTGQIALLAQLPYEQRQTYTVTVVTSSGTTTWSFAVGDVPGAPTVTAAPSGAGELTVSWQPADGHGLPITSYRVDDVTSGQFQVVGGGQTSATFGGVPIGVLHEFRVVATNDLGNGPPGAAAAVAIDAPEAPAIVSVVPGSASAFVSWTFTQKESAPASGFQVQLDNDPPLNVGYVTERTLAALQDGHTYTVRVRATNMTIAGAWSETRTVTPTAAGRLFHGLPLPVRAIDTRAASGPVDPGEVLAVPVVPATGVTPTVVAAISMNVTATNATGPGYFTAWPCDQPQPLASSLNYAGGEPGVPNHAIVPVARDGTVCITTGVHAADVIVDVDGWFSFSAGLTPETPRRALDTRPTGPTTDAAVAAVPAGSLAAVVNLTTAGGSGAAGFVTAYPCGTAIPLASNLNFEAGQVVANAAVVPVAADGSLCLHASTPTNLVVDVAGAVTDNYVAATPTRLLDTRQHDGPVTEAIVSAAPPGSAAAILNVTAAGGSTADGFITVYPADVPLPPTSNVNFRAGQVVPNAAVVHPDVNGAGKLTTSTAVQLVVDTFGSFL